MRPSYDAKLIPPPLLPRISFLVSQLKGADGVRSVYDMFRKVPGISADNAPALFEYLAETKQ